MNNILYIDTEDGSQTIGGEQAIEKQFGNPVVRVDSWSELDKLIFTEIYHKAKVVKTQKIGGGLQRKSEQIIYQLNKGVKLDGIIIDTFSSSIGELQKSISNGGRMTQQFYGNLKLGVDRMLKNMSKLPGVLVVTIHASDKQLEDGTTVIKPQIDGSSKDEIAKWFDFVIYADTISKGKEMEWVWITKKSSKYYHAKDRTDLLPPVMKQDFQPVLEAARKKQFKAFKVLIIGAPGSGKTRCLQTLTTK